MKEEDFQVKIGDIMLEHPVMNAAGTCKHISGDKDGIKAFIMSSVSAVMIGTITKDFCAGNQGKDFYAGNNFVLNSAGLPNPGLKYYKEIWPHIERCCIEASNGPKPIFVSVFGFGLEEFVALVDFFQEKVSLIELNLSCPNIGEQVVCYNPDNISNILKALSAFFGDKVGFAIKLAPFVDIFLLNQVVKIIAGFPIVKAITTCNSFPNAWDCDDSGRPRIHSVAGNVLGGMSGSALMPIALGQVVQIKDILDELGSDIKIIGVGGIQSGYDVWKFLEAGAVAVQICSAFLQKPDLKIFDKILSEFIEVSENFIIRNDPWQS